MPSSRSTSGPVTNNSASPLPLLRREVVALRTRILELQDQLLSRETERADAVALLGQAELLLEEKIAYIIELDRTLSLRVRELENECDLKTGEIDRRGAAMVELQASDVRHRQERDAIIGDLSQRLDAANREIGQAHEIARQLDLEKTKTLATLTAERALHESTREHLKAGQEALSQTAVELESKLAELQETKSRLNHSRAELSSTMEQHDDARCQLDQIHTSFWWRLGRPWRALFGPKP